MKNSICPVCGRECVPDFFCEICLYCDFELSGYADDRRGDTSPRYTLEALEQGKTNFAKGLTYHGKPLPGFSTLLSEIVCPVCGVKYKAQDPVVDHCPYCDFEYEDIDDYTGIENQSRSENSVSYAEAKANFLKGLDAYANPLPMKECLSILQNRLQAGLSQKYGEIPCTEIMIKLNSETEDLFDWRWRELADVVYLLRFLDHLKKERIPYGVTYCGLPFLSYLMGISFTNPLPPHYYCPVCKRVEFVKNVKDGFDLAPKKCRCGGIMEGDGHGIYSAGLSCHDYKQYWSVLLPKDQMPRLTEFFPTHKLWLDQIIPQWQKESHKIIELGAMVGFEGQDWFCDDFMDYEKCPTVEELLNSENAPAWGRYFQKGMHFSEAIASGCRLKKHILGESFEAYTEEGKDSMTILCWEDLYECLLRNSCSEPEAVYICGKDIRRIDWDSVEFLSDSEKTEMKNVFLMVRKAKLIEELIFIARCKSRESKETKNKNCALTEPASNAEDAAKKLQRQIDLCKLDLGASFLHRGEPWNDFEVLIPAYKAPVYYTYPFVIFTKDNIARISTSEESLAYSEYREEVVGKAMDVLIAAYKEKDDDEDGLAFLGSIIAQPKVADKCGGEAEAYLYFAKLIQDGMNLMDVFEKAFEMAEFDMTKTDDKSFIDVLKEILHRANEHTVAILGDNISYEIDGVEYLRKDLHCKEHYDEICACPVFEIETANMHLFVRLREEKVITKEEWLFRYIEIYGFAKEQFLKIVNVLDDKQKLSELISGFTEEQECAFPHLLCAYHVVFPENK